MNTFRICMIALFSTAALAFSARSAEKSADFEKLKALSGDWDVAKGSGDHVAPGGTVTYKLTAGGSAVLETLFGGTEHEMVTIYYVDGDKLVLTHYCMLQNQPHMHAETSNGNSLVFKVKTGENPKLDAEDHMHQATFTFVDADHLKTEWVLYKGGKADSTHSFELTRKKKR